MKICFEYFSQSHRLARYFLERPVLAVVSANIYTELEIMLNDRICAPSDVRCSPSDIRWFVERTIYDIKFIK